MRGIGIGTSSEGFGRRWANRPDFSEVGGGGVHVPTEGWKSYLFGRGYFFAI